MNSNVWERQYNKHGLEAQRFYPNEELLRFFGGNYFQLDKTKRGKIRILELGCGSGANLWMIAKEGFNAFGVDISSAGVKLCSKMLAHWGTNASIKVGDMLSIPYKDNYFDAVVDVVSMQHLTFSQHVKAYAEVQRVLKKEGKFFSYHLGNKSYSYKKGEGKHIDRFTVDNISNPKAPLANNGTPCFPTEKAIEEILNKLGFKNTSIENVIKTYNNRKIIIQYLVIKAQK